VLIDRIDFLEARLAHLQGKVQPGVRKSHDYP